MNNIYRPRYDSPDYWLVLVLAALLIGTELPTGASSLSFSASAPAQYEWERPMIESIPYDWVAEYPLIAHALGGIGGYPGTNSLEALQHAYRSGYRVFETDLCVTSDGRLVLRHDWEAGTYPVLGQRAPDAAHIGPMTLSQFMSLKIQHRYTPMTFTSLVRFMAEHPDMLLVTDTKEPEPDKAAVVFKRLVRETKEVDGDVLRRIIPQLYEENNYEAVSAVYPFKQYIYTLYMNRDSEDRVVEFTRAKGIRVVVMDEARYSPAFVQALKKNGVAVYINTINDPNRIKHYQAAGVRGVMTDFVPPGRFK